MYPSLVLHRFSVPGLVLGWSIFVKHKFRLIDNSSVMNLCSFYRNSLHNSNFSLE